MKQALRFALVLLCGMSLARQSAAALPQPKKGPLQVFVLAGQSNMQGQGMVSGRDKDGQEKPGTLAAMLKDPAKAPLIRHLVDAQGNWSEKRDDVWVYDVSEFGNRHGVLEFGYGWALGSRQWFGPELEFGHVMARQLNCPVLIIKTAWGGKSLYKDFRPPSSGGATGPNYTEMIATVNQVVGNLKDLFPKYDGSGYRLAGFVWWHGWNDFCGPPTAVSEYESHLVNLIRDVRRDLRAPQLPVVIGEFTGPWGAECKESNAVGIRRAQHNAAVKPEFAGRVRFVETHDFVRTQEQSPSGETYHEFKNGETYLLIGHAFGKAMLQVLRGIPAPVATPAVSTPPNPFSGGPQMTGFGTGSWGHMGVGLAAEPEEYRFGFTLYSAAWPLLENPMPRYQSGLVGTWIYPFYTKPNPANVYNSMEGGLGWWQNTQFLTRAPKFSMGGVPGAFNRAANSPGWPGSTQPLPPKKMGIAQLSPWLLFPPDGITLKKNTNGELFGYGYMALPLTEPKATTAGQPVPTGNHCWTLFFNTENFKGPVAFFTPYFWSRISLENPEMSAQGLDSRPASNGGQVAMEVGSTPRFLSVDKAGVVYSRIPVMQFPVDEMGQSVLVHNVTRYSKQALWNPCVAWFSGKLAASGKFDEQGVLVAANQGFNVGLQQWSDQNQEIRTPVKGLKGSVEGANLDPTTWGFQWHEAALHQSPGGLRRGTFPEYYRSEHNTWKAVAPDQVPDETGLKTVTFPYGKRPKPQPYIAPEEPGSCWKMPGPQAGPFKAQLNDGSVVTYYWYRFVDQPTLQNADLSGLEKMRLQAVVEKIHGAWSMTQEYMPGPSRGTLAGLDPALIVQPPKGLEVGYVPIVTRQEAAQPSPAAKNPKPTHAISAKTPQ